MKAILSILLILAAAGGASAGYTDYAWNESNKSECRSYFDCGDWSEVNNPKNLGLVRYGSDYSDPATLPAEVQFVAATDPSRIYDDITWIFLHVQGFDKHLWHNGTIYTDEPMNINYIQGYYDEGVISEFQWNSLWARSVVGLYKNDDSTKAVAQISIKYLCVVKYPCGENNEDICYRYEYVTKDDQLADKIDYTLWGEIDRDINVQLVNHSTYCILTVPTPANITGIKIVATSANTTAVYETHIACLQLNTSRDFVTCDLIEHNFTNTYCLSPYGHDRYLLSYEPDYSINITLYTPFEQIHADVVMSDTIIDPEPLAIHLSPLGNVVMLILIPYLIYRIVRMM